MNKPVLKTTLAQIRNQRAALAKVRAEAEDLEDYLTVLETLPAILANAFPWPRCIAASQLAASMLLARFVDR